MVKKFIQASLFVFVCLNSSTLFAETTPLLAENLTLLIQHVQDLEQAGITTDHIIEHCSTPCNHLTSTTLSIEAQKLLDQHLHELGTHGITLEQIIDYCVTLAKQKQLDEDNTSFYQNLLWVGVGSLVATGVVILVYSVPRGNSTEVDQAKEDRAHRGRRATIDDINEGFANIDRIINDDNQDPALRRILAEVNFNDNELRDIPLDRLHNAADIILRNMYGRDLENRMADLYNLMDRRRRIGG